jgi:hypothetical protein
MVSGPERFSIEEAFQKLSCDEVRPEVPPRPEFRDPLIVSFQAVSLSRLIDEELERHYNPSGSGPVEMITRMFRRLRGN